MENIVNLKKDIIQSTADAGTGLLDDVFQLFAKSDDPECDEGSITLDNTKVWLKQANVLDEKKVTNDDITTIFAKCSKNDKSLSQKEFEEFLGQLATDKKMDKNEIMISLKSCDTSTISGGKVTVTGGVRSKCQDTGNVCGTEKDTCDDKSKCDKK